MSEPKGEWKPVEFLIGPSKAAKWAEGDEWSWKKPFQELKKSVIRVEDKWHIILTAAEEELDEIHAMCDGRHRIETLFKYAEEIEDKVCPE